MSNPQQSSGSTKSQVIRDGGTIKGGVVKPSPNPAPRPPSPTGQGGSGKTTNQGGGGGK